MPINRLELWAAMLSQIVTESVFREFYTERDVVTEERRSGIDNNPNGKMAEILLQNAFQNGPYQWSTAGPEEDIQGYLLEDAKAFQEKHYVPSQMVGVLVGDIEIDKAKKIITKYFGNITSREAPPEPIVSNNTGGGTVQFEFDAQPSMLMAFHKPTLPDPEEYVFDVVTTLLCDGPTSRLYRKLVIEKRVANRVSCSDAYPGSRLPNLFLLWVEPMNGASLKQLEKMIAEELDLLKKVPVGEEELQRVRNKVAAAFIFGLETNGELAMGLARFETIFNDWRLLITYPNHVEKVTQGDVMELAKKYLNQENRTVVERIQK
jgi:predicted Zn-dependent peptidase